MSDDPVVVQATPELAPLRHGPFLFHEDGLVVDGDSLPSFDECADMGHVLSLAHKGLAFAVGDWLNYVEDRFGEAAAQLVDSRYFAEETLRVYRWVTKQIPRDQRFPTLTFKHHMIVAALPPERRRNWLGKASINNWTVAELQKELKDTAEPGKVVLWLVVKCQDHKDLEDLKAELEGKGRTCKEKEERKVVVGKTKKQLTAKPKAGKGKRRGKK